MFRIDRKLVNLSGTPGAHADVSGHTAAVSSEEAAKAQEEAEALGREAAEELLEGAKAEARIIMREAELEAQDLKERSRAEGYAEGKAEGKAEGARETELQRKEDEESIRHVLSELERERERIIGDMEEEIINLTFSMVKKIVNLAEEIDDKVFESMIIKALRKVKLEGWVTIRVSSAEYEKYFSSGSAAFVLGEETVTASVIPDAAIDSWDCVIDTGDGTINAGLDSQLKQIRIAFNGASDL